MKMFKFQVKDLMPLARAIVGLQDQGVVYFGARKVFFFHGTTSRQENLRLVERYKQFLTDKDCYIFCCHGTLFPEWVQRKFVHPELVTEHKLCSKILDTKKGVVGLWVDAPDA